MIFFSIFISKREIDYFIGRSNDSLSNRLAKIDRIGTSRSDNISGLGIEKIEPNGIGKERIVGLETSRDQVELTLIHRVVERERILDNREQIVRMHIRNRCCCTRRCCCCFYWWLTTIRGAATRRASTCGRCREEGSRRWVVLIDRCAIIVRVVVVIFGGYWCLL